MANKKNAGQVFWMILLALIVGFAAANLPALVAHAAEVKLTASDAAAWDEFGYSVSISGDYAIVGAQWNDDAGGNSGSAYIFYRNEGGINNWGEQAKLTASDAATGDLFGGSVSISGDYAIVGARGNDHAGGTDAGAAYIFVRSGTSWTEQAKLTASDGAADDWFGANVSISGDYVVVGAYAYYAEDRPGSAYIFYRNQGGSNSWGQQAKLTASDAAAGDNFGDSVSISGDYVIVGARYNDDAGSNSGSAYIFYRDQGGSNNWGQQAKLTASDAAAGDYFGGVSISGDYVVVGASYNDDAGTNSGSAYIFYRNQGGSDNWGQQAKLTASDGAASDYFGTRVSISGNYVIVGAIEDDPGGSAYSFLRSGSSWSQRAKVTASDAATWDRFGGSVSISGNYVIIGTKQNDDAGTDSGSAYIYHSIDDFSLPPIPPTISSLNPNHGTPNGGTAVTITGEKFVDGATVTFGGVNAASVTVNSNTQITVVTPAGNRGTVDVKVTRPDGLLSDTLTNGFAYNQIYPVVDSPKMNGSEFWVDIACHQEDLFNISFKLNYNTTVLDVLVVEITNALGVDLVSDYNVNETAGRVGIGISRKDGAGNTNVAGSIARVKFVGNVQEDTVATFSFSDVHIYQVDGAEFPAGADSADVTISRGVPPTASASDITDVPTVMYQNMSYSLSSKYSDGDGYDDLNNLWLTFDNGEVDITLQAEAGATATNQTATVTQGSSYVTSATYDRSSSGTDTTVTWHFTLNDTWIESTEIDLIVQCRDDENNTSQVGTLDANIDFVIDKAAPTNVGLNTPANNATDVPVDTSLTILTAADSDVGLADLPYWIELATDTNFTENLQNSDWVASTSWTPPTTLTPSTVYYWRVKARDKIGNVSLYCGHTADSDGYGRFTTHNSTPTALASDITGVPTVIFQNKSYTITSKYSDADGYVDLDELWLTFDNGDNDIVFKAEADDTATSIQTTIESGSDYVTSTTYDRTADGNDITIDWTFTLNDTWIESSAIDLIVKCDDKHDAASTPDTLDANITYDNDVEPPTNVGLSEPANNASAVHTDSTLTVLTATDAGIGLASQPYFIQLATNPEFTEGVQESDWISSTTFDPDLLPATTYYWRVKAKDGYGNESGYCGHTADAAGYGTFSTAYYVWPGDLNNNGTVNEEDLHPLGSYWDNTGPARARFYQLWNGEPAEPWGVHEMTYADANGTGVIDEADVLPIGFNWAKTHPVPPQPQVILVATASSPPLTVHAPRILKPGEKFTVSVELGDNARKVEKLFGVSFALQYDQTKFIKATQIQSQDIIGKNPLHIDHIDQENGIIGFAVTRKAGQDGVDKNGIVAKIDFKVSDKAPLGTPVDFSIIRSTVKIADDKRIPVNINSAWFVVGYLGDVTLDSKVDRQDAVQILRHVVGLRQASSGQASGMSYFSRGQQMLADVSGDGTVSAYDVALILQRLSGIVNRFPQDAGQ